jgi:hypothetical protein
MELVVLMERSTVPPMEQPPQEPPPLGQPPQEPPPQEPPPPQEQPPQEPPPLGQQQRVWPPPWHSWLPSHALEQRRVSLSPFRQQFVFVLLHLAFFVHVISPFLHFDVPAEHCRERLY